MALYEGTILQMVTMAWQSKSFEIGVGVHQGSPLSPLLLITVMEETTKTIRGEGIWEQLYADDVVSTGKRKWKLWKNLTIGRLA